MNRFAVVLIVLTLGACATQRQADHKRELLTSSDQSEEQKRARIRLQLAIEYFEQRQLDVALDELKQAIQIDPNLSDAYGVRALVYMDKGETRLAEDNFLQALKLTPENPDLLNNYGWFLCQNGQFKQSLGYFERVLKNRSYHSPVKALNNAGICSLKQKDLATAERYFSQAFKIEPGDPSTNGNLAKIHYDRGEFERARFYIGRVIKADVLNADVLWLAIKIEHKMNDDKVRELSLGTQLRRRYPNSPEYSAYQRGAFDE